jgi:crossover junction endodeoxyribonuclease RuvC
LNKGQTRILGIDPGLRVTGFGIIEKDGSRLSYIASGTIKSGEGELPERLGALFRGLTAVLEEHQPQEVAIEKVFVNVNPQSTLLLGQARGAAIVAAVHQGITVAEYTALQIKQAVVGNGHADKQQVQEMVKRLLSLTKAPAADPADALACAICHAQQCSGGNRAAACRLNTEKRKTFMIGRLRGVLISKNAPFVMVDVNGVGYEVEVPVSTLSALPSTEDLVVLHTHLVVREDAHLLYGFASLHERNAFRMLLKVSGVGPKLALALLSGLSVSELAGVVVRQDVTRLTRISGVGKKTAERLLLELRDKFKDAGVSLGPEVGSLPRDDVSGDVANALTALGYNDKEVAHALKAIPVGTPVEESIRLSLRLLSRID